MYFLNKNKKGFTLVELIVVIGIFLVLMALILIRYTNIKSNISVEALAQDIAISVRKAQLYSVGVKGVNNDFSSGFGIVFNINDPKSYVLFADVDSNGAFDGDIQNDCGVPHQGDECMEKITITSMDEISDLRYDGFSCTSDNLEIFFKRPYLTAEITCGSSQANTEGGIEIVNQEGKKKKIIIPLAGNIYVE